jgi:hypothetical protein
MRLWRKSWPRGERSTRSRAATLAATLVVAALGASGCGGSSSTTSATHTTSTATHAHGASATPGHPTTRATQLAPAVKAAYFGFAACMRAKGVSMPEPNINDSGPVFDPKKIDTSSPHFASAMAVCRAQLIARVRAAAKSG